MKSRKQRLREMMMDYRTNGTHAAYAQVEGQIRPLIYHCLRSRFRDRLNEQQRQDLVDDVMPLVEKQVREYVFVCPKCKQKFKTEQQLVEHGAVVHGTEALRPAKWIEEVAKFSAKHNAFRYAVKFLKTESLRRFPTRNGEEMDLANLAIFEHTDIETRVELVRIMSKWGVTGDDLLGYKVKPSVRHKIYAEIRRKVELHT